MCYMQQHRKGGWKGGGEEGKWYPGRGFLMMPLWWCSLHVYDVGQWADRCQEGSHLSHITV